MPTLDELSTSVTQLTSTVETLIATVSEAADQLQAEVDAIEPGGDLAGVSGAIENLRSTLAGLDPAALAPLAKNDEVDAHATREELNQLAKDHGVEGAEKMRTKQDVIDAIEAATAP